LLYACLCTWALQARKIEETPFPFPYAQLITFMLYSFAITFPLLAASKVGDGGLTKIFSAMLTFLVVLCYFGLHEVARTLEDPFLHPPNDLPAVGLQMEFNSRLLAAWDGCYLPLDTCDVDSPSESPANRLLERRVHRRLRRPSADGTLRETAAMGGLQVTTDGLGTPQMQALNLRSRASPNKFWHHSDRSFPPTTRRFNSGDSASSYGSAGGPLGGSRALFGSLLNPLSTTSQDSGASGTSVIGPLEGGTMSSEGRAVASPVLSHRGSPPVSGADGRAPLL
jgi:hypothetical protein